MFRVMRAAARRSSAAICMAQGPEPNAQTTTVGKATINASAISRGNGGTVAIYSTGNTSVAANILAKGGIISGNGGMVETSGHILSGANDTTVSTLAPHGTAGTWLLDPDYIVIDNCTLSCIVGNILFGGSGSDEVDATTLGLALNLSNVTLQANLDITVNAAVTASSDSVRVWSLMPDAPLF